MTLEKDKLIYYIMNILEEDDDRIPLIELEFGENGIHHLHAMTEDEKAHFEPIMHRHLGTNYMITTQAEHEARKEALRQEAIAMLEEKKY